ncbi:GNAT family N-acetyltransferase [Niabella defluvii]|nr:GNAT family N-acetyltransferase [Niabella sp. I65]
MITIRRTNSEDNNFLHLVVELDKDLAKRNGDSNDFFAQFNKTDLIKNVVVAFSNNTPAGCGAMKPYDQSAMEIKRMFVKPHMRGNGIAVAVLQELETWAKELGYIKSAYWKPGIKCAKRSGFIRKPVIKLFPIMARTKT